MYFNAYYCASVAGLMIGLSAAYPRRGTNSNVFGLNFESVSDLDLGSGLGALDRDAAPTDVLNIYMYKLD